MEEEVCRGCAGERPLTTGDKLTGRGHDGGSTWGLVYISPIIYYVFPPCLFSAHLLFQLSYYVRLSIQSVFRGGGSEAGGCPEVTSWSCRAPSRVNREAAPQPVHEPGGCRGPGGGPPLSISVDGTAVEVLLGDLVRWAWGVDVPLGGPLPAV